MHFDLFDVITYCVAVAVAVGILVGTTCYARGYAAGQEYQRFLNRLWRS